MRALKFAAGFITAGAIFAIGFTACSSDAPPAGPSGDLPSTMFDSTTGILMVGQDIEPGTYSATPVDGEGFYARQSCLDDTDACVIESGYIDSPTTITVGPDDVALTIAYIQLGK